MIRQRIYGCPGHGIYIRAGEVSARLVTSLGALHGGGKAAPVASFIPFSPDFHNVFLMI